MKILAMDLGKNKSVFVDYTPPARANRTFGKIGTNCPRVAGSAGAVQRRTDW